MKIWKTKTENWQDIQRKATRKQENKKQQANEEGIANKQGKQT